MFGMAGRRGGTPAPPEDFEENIVDIDVGEEMRGSYLEYAYSVIYSGALPEARDGLKPVQRRILYQMNEMGLRPDRAHVKCARVVGEVMGRLHPHGDSAIYDALARMAQPWAMRLPLVDGHGNFGSMGGDDQPAAMRYTEARLTAAAMEMVASIDEDTVDFIPNYDGSETQPDVLPAGIPNLLVNGTAGIAVGMATNMAPHNLGEVVAAARHLLRHPDASLDTLMRYVPGPDLPTGGRIVGLDGIREAYETGRGIFRTRATATISQLTPRRSGIVVTELPYSIGPEKVMTRIKDLVQAKKLNGIADLKDLTDRNRGLHLVIEVRSGFNPEAVLAELYRLTPMEETFGINNVALVDGQPRVLGLRELLEIFVAHRLDVIRRRTEYRRPRGARRRPPGDAPPGAPRDNDQAIAAAVPLEVADDPCVVLMSGTGLVARAAVASGDDSERALVPPPAEASRTAHDVIVAAARATVRGTVGLVTSAGRLIKLNVLELPAMPPGAGAVSLAGGTPVTEFASFDRGETVVGLAAMDSLVGDGLALGTAEGVVKRVLADYPQNRDEFELITLKAGDRVLGAVQLSAESD